MPSEDKANAISGIGKVLEDVRSDEYLGKAAMFRKNLLFQLDW